MEEMSGTAVARGALFHAATHRRIEIEFGPELRRQVEVIVEQVRAMLDAQRVPLPVADARCRHCSLADSCLPGVLADVAGCAAWDSGLWEVSDLAVES